MSEVEDLKKLIEVLVELYMNMHLNDPECNARLTTVVELQMNNLLSIKEMLDLESLEVLLKIGFDYEKAIGKPLNELFVRTIEALYS